MHEEEAIDIFVMPRPVGEGRYKMMGGVRPSVACLDVTRERKGLGCSNWQDESSSHD